MGAMKNHGLAVIDFKRSIMPHDSVDAPIPMEGPVQVKKIYIMNPQIRSSVRICARPLLYLLNPLT